MMEAQRGPFDIDWGFWIMLAVILFVSAISVVALLTLRRRPMDEIPRFLWTLLIKYCNRKYCKYCNRYFFPDNIHSLAMVHAAIESAESGRRVRMDQP